MIALAIEFALFFLVLFFVMPALLIFLMVLRELIHQHRKHTASPTEWRRRSDIADRSDIAELTVWQEAPPA